MEALWLFVEFVGPDRRAGTINRRHVERWLMEMKRAPTSTRHPLGVLSGFCDWCVAHGYMRRNPTDGISRVRVLEPVPRALTAEQVAAVVRACPDNRSRLIVLLECQEMLRRMEVAAVQLGDINVKERLRRSGRGHRRLTNA
jgi:integrase